MPKDTEEPVSKKPRAGMAKNFVWVGIGYGLYTICQWGILSILARLTDPATVGQFGIATAIATPITIFARLGLRVGKATDVQGDFAFADYFSLNLVSSGVALIVIAIVASLWDAGPGGFFIILMMGVCRVIESQGDLIYGLYQLNDRLKSVAASLIFRGFLALAAFSLALWLTGSLIVGLIAQAAAWLTVYLLYDIPTGSKLLTGVDSIETKDGSPPSRLAALHFRWRRAEIKRVLFKNLPLGFGIFIGQIRKNIPQYLVQTMLGLEAAGYFTAIFYIQNAALLMITAIGGTIVTRLARFLANKQIKAFVTFLAKLLTLLVLAGVVAFGIVWTMGEDILTVLYGPAYAEYNNVFKIIVIGGAMTAFGVILDFGVISSRWFKIQPLQKGAIFLTSIAVGYPMVLYYGLEGAAWAVAIAAVAQISLYSVLNGIVISRIRRKGSAV